ncbi:MAG: hypothetical protein H8E44_09690 [Planctomycetes bacterium]|nr:hypothetical protein [Planctomycetota bacterium]MBL7042470.1 hypothetical protein [Pirellulaceae bacterium]
MRSCQFTRLVYGMKSRFCRPLFIALAVAMALAACGWFSDANAAAKRKSRKKGREPAAQAAKSDDAKPAEDVSAKRTRAKKRQGHRLDPTVLRYMPDDCCVFGQIEVAPILQSGIGRKLTRDGSGFWDDHRERFAPLGLEVDQIERIALGAQSFDGGEISQYVSVLFCKQPVAWSEKEVAADGSPWTTEKIGTRMVWVKEGKEPWAVCAVDDRIVLAGSPDSLRAVLKRDGPIELPETLDQARRQLDTSAAFAMSFLSSDAIGQMISIGSPIGSQLAGQIEAINVELDFDADLAVRVAAVCSNEAAAQQLNGLGTGFLALIQMQSLEDQEPEVRDLIRSISFNVEGPVLTTSMKVPGELVNASTECSGQTAKPARLLAPAGRPETVPKLSGIPLLTPIPPMVLSNNNAPAPAAFSPYGVAPQYAPTPTSPPTYAGPIAIPVPAPWGQPYQRPEQPTLEIADVIRLVEAGVDDEVIVCHMQKHCLAAMLTADDLILLTKSGASKQVITALQQIPLKAKTSPAGAKNPEYPPYQPGGQAQAPTPEPDSNEVPQQSPLSSEDLRRLQKTWERIWFYDEPDHMTPERVHGGVI